MRKGYLLVLLACLFAVPAFGVPSHENYIGDNDVSGWMYSYYGSWTPGQAPTGGAENENFYIGRVRPMKRFTNTATQVIQDDATSIQRRADRKLLWWVPINQTDKGGWRSLPSYCFDSEAFSMWSYITTYGNWTEGFLRQPGAFADACHKNGVLSGVVSAAPWAQTLSASDGGHGQNYNALVTGGADKLLKLMTYYGIDGLGFNSEQSWGTLFDSMKTLMTNCHNNKGNYAIGDRLYFAFYELDNCLDNSNDISMNSMDGFFPYANAYFLNYNWSETLLNTSKSTADAKGGTIATSYDVYAGMDQQGRSYADWVALSGKNLSIGIWGAHNKNMIYEGSTEDGTTSVAIQNCYLRKSEQFFTGGTQNPVNDKTISNVLCSGNKDFFGVSKLMAAKSALSWVANDYFPFISYMNLGNGEFFNNEGETTFDHEWYNIGMQDHLPTWRWWITDTYMGRATSNVPKDTKATFTYEDAWFGGSCMKVTFDAAVTGTTNARYIQLYKTEFPINEGDTYTLRVRYKVLQGSAAMHYMLSTVGAEGTATRVPMGTMNKTEWAVLEKDLPTSFNKATIAQIGMAFQNIKAGTEILIGEVALVKNDVDYEPVKPTIDTAKTKWLKTTSRGVDFKIIWNCTPTETASSAPIQKAVAATYCTPSATNDSDYDRYTRVVSLTGSQSGTWTSETLQTAKGQALYFDKTGTTVTVKPGETLTPSLEYHGEWMHKFVFIDLNKDGDFTDAGEAVSYGYLESTGQNSAGQTVANSSTANPPAFTAPTTEGTYRIRFKIDWGSELAPCGTSKDFYKGGFMADFTLNVSNDEGGSGGGTTGPSTGTVSSEGAPIYNDEVHTWYYEIFAQQEGKAEQLVTTTTTWAAYAVEVPFDLEGSLKVRAGVRAVAPDGTTKSEIAWSDYMSASDITIIEGFSVDKPVIKPNEVFEISFDDERHDPAAHFRILKTDGTELVKKTNVRAFTYQIAEKGLYDVEVKYTNQSNVEVTEIARAMVQVSGPEVGAMPEIEKLTADGKTVSSSQMLTNTGAVTFDLNYEGKEANGTSSRALRLVEKGFGVKASDVKTVLGKSLGSTPFTLAFWFKPENLRADQSTHLLNVRSPSDTWPASDWGFIWSAIGSSGNNFSLSFRLTGNGGTEYNTVNYTFKEGYWYHIAVVADRSSSGYRKLTLYLNGSSSGLTVAKKDADGNVSTSPEWISDLYNFKDDNIIYIGGIAANRSGFDGFLDEFQLWDKALSEDEVKTAMWHFDTPPANLIGYWDFEAEPDASGYLLSTGQKTNLKGFVANSWSLADGTNDEGESNMVQKPTIGAGSPFLAGSFPITTTPSWKYTGTPSAKGAVTGDDQSGSTTVSYDTEGTYTATLTLENPWGKDTESIELVVVDGTVDLEGNVIENLNVYPNPFVEALHIQFAKAGDYELEVLSLDGRLVQSQSVNAAAGQITRVAVNGETGAYLVRVKMQGTVVKTVKLVKK